MTDIHAMQENSQPATCPLLLKRHSNGHVIASGENTGWQIN